MATMKKAPMKKSAAPKRMTKAAPAMQAPMQAPPPGAGGPPPGAGGPSMMKKGGKVKVTAKKYKNGGSVDSYTDYSKTSGKEDTYTDYSGKTSKADSYTNYKTGGKIKKAKTGGSFPDLNKDGKITKADVLVGRGVVKAKSGAKMKKGKC